MNMSGPFVLLSALLALFFSSQASAQVTYDCRNAPGGFSRTTHPRPGCVVVSVAAEGPGPEWSPTRSSSSDNTTPFVRVASRQGPITKGWVLFNMPNGDTFNTNGAIYRSAVVQQETNCKNHTFANTVTVAYKDLNGRGDVVGNWRSHGAHELAPPNTLASGIIEAMCAEP